MVGAVLVFYFVGYRLNKSIILAIFFIPLLWKPNSLLHRTSCPNCFGTDLCEHLDNGQLKLHWWSRFLLIFHPKLIKSVFFGILNDSEVLVLKSMTRGSQINPNPVKYVSSEKKLLNRIINNNILLNDGHVRKVILCPNIRSLRELFNSVSGNFSFFIDKGLWLDIQISIEPLLLKFFGSSQYVPVPKYIGACGDIIFKEFKGTSLSKYYSADWMKRVFLSIQLLNMAEKFTFAYENLVFYFLDISPDNLAVDSKGTIYLVDLDHVIVGEKIIKSNNSALLSNIHVSIILDPLKLGVIPSEICQGSVSDHNYFAICKYMLLYTYEMGKGLLDDIPENFSHIQFDLQTALNECSSPNKFSNRIVAARSLSEMLKSITSDFQWT